MKLDTGNLIHDLERWSRAYIDNIKGLSYSNNTIKLYKSAINAFIEHMRAYQDDITIKDINTIYITTYLSYIEEEYRKRNRNRSGSISKSTKTTYLKAIRSFFTFISDNNDEFRTYENYFKNIRISGIEKREERMSYLSEEEVERLLDVLEEEKSRKGDYAAYRNALFIKLLYYAGLRTSEALGLRRCDFELIDRGFFRIEIAAKGGKIQHAYLHADAVSDELAYYDRELNIEPGDPLFVTKNGKPLDRHAAYRMAGRLFRKAGIFHKRGLHILRHSLAMHLVKQKTDPLRIQKILRHASINSTMVYAKADERDVIEALSNVLPQN